MSLVRRVLIAAGLGLLAGCSPQAGPAAPEALQLQEVNDLLRGGAGAAGRPAAGLADLAGYQSMYPRGYEAVQSGDVVVLWGAPLAGEGETGKNEAVVAYEKAVPTDGGYVLLSAGMVKKMSAGEFASAPKGAP